MTGGCCGPIAQRGVSPAAPSSPAAQQRSPGRPVNLVDLPGGEFLMGSIDTEAYPADGEGPVRAVRVAPFSMQAYAVTNAEFAAFVDHTGYVTEAEHFRWSFVFGGLLPDEFPPTRGVAATPWWREMPGASWRLPAGPLGRLTARSDHPVVHVSWRDATSYAQWAGLRLAGEAEWEYAARGGLVQQPYPWGAELAPAGQPSMNIWQGRFPGGNAKGADWVGTEPVDAYQPNGFGLYNMTGNVWEWCGGESAPGLSATRGGPYLCHASYCRRYRVSARQQLPRDSTTGNVGFRCVAT